MPVWITAEKVEADFDDVTVAAFAGSQLRERTGLRGGADDARRAAEYEIAQSCLRPNHPHHVSASPVRGEVLVCRYTETV